MTVTVVVGTALLAVIVFVLHLNEKVRSSGLMLLILVADRFVKQREDEMERRKLSHHINFDAL